MILSPYQLSSRLVVTLAFLVLAQLVVQPLPPTPAARDEQRMSAALPRSSRPTPSSIVNVSVQTIAPQFPIPHRSTKVQDAGEILTKLGPVFTASFSMSKFSVEGYVGGGWPLMIEYELEADSTAQVTISSNNGSSLSIELAATNDQRAEFISKLPAVFGKDPQAGLVSFEALKNGPEPRKPAHFFLYGLGLGHDAVGSMVIEQLEFQPANIHPKLKEKASYSFRSRSDFDTVSVEFRRITLSGGIVTTELAAANTLKKGVRPGEFVTDFWDGKNSKGKPSLGPHQFFVHAWRGPKRGADWVFAAEEQVVTVE